MRSIITIGIVACIMSTHAHAAYIVYRFSGEVDTEYSSYIPTMSSQLSILVGLGKDPVWINGYIQPTQLYGEIDGHAFSTYPDFAVSQARVAFSQLNVGGSSTVDSAALRVESYVPGIPQWQTPQAVIEAMDSHEIDWLACWPSRYPQTHCPYGWAQGVFWLPKSFGEHAATWFKIRQVDIITDSIDVYLDNRIDGADLGLLSNYWGTPSYDITGDAIVDGADIAEIYSNWNTSVDSQPVPEPTGVYALIIMLLSRLRQPHK